MNVDLGIWSKLTRAVVVLVWIAAVLGVVVWYLPLIRQNEAMRKENYRLDFAIRQEREKAYQLDAAIKALHSDPKAVERLAREKLSYAKTGETVIRFEPPTGYLP